MPYAIYLRKSRADQDAERRGEGETLARHRVMLEALAKRNHHPISEQYAEVVSGESISNRPQMQRLLTDVAAGKYEGVYVMEVERLARGDTSDQGRVAQTFLLSKTKIITPTKTYDPTNEFDTEYFEFSLFMSRKEYKTINRRIQAGRMQSVREGRYICSRPAYGYRKVKIPNEKGYTLAIDPEEAAVVRMMFDMYLHSDMGIVRISNYLTDNHIPVGEQGTGWRWARVYRMLTNEVYIGKLTWGKVKQITQLTPDGIEKRRVSQSAYERYDGLFEPIVDEMTFRAVQNKLHAPRAIPKSKGTPMSNPLSGLVVCSQCGHYMSGLPACGRQPAIIKCLTRGCSTVGSYREPVEEAILNTLRGWLKNVNMGSEERPAAEPDQTLVLEAERVKVARQIAKIQELVEQEVYTIEQYNQRFSVLSDRLREIDTALKAARADKPVRYAPISLLAPDIQHVLDAYSVSSPAEKNRLLHACVSKIVYTKSVRGFNLKGDERVSPNQFSLEIYPQLL